MKWFGGGLGVGADSNHLETFLGKAGIRDYQELQRQPDRYFWVGIGQDMNLGYDETYVAVSPFSGDATRALIEANPHIWKRGPRL